MLLIQYFLKYFFKIHFSDPEELAIDIVFAIALIGLQKNLLSKLEYITLRHPIRDFIYPLFKN